MIVRKCVVDVHVFEIRLHVLIKEALDLIVIKARVNEDGSDKCFHNVRQALKQVLF